MRYEVIFTQDGWGVRDSHTGRMVDENVPTVDDARRIAEEHERHDVRVEVSISRWAGATSA